MITPDDRRHGTHAGYVAGCRLECCRAARRRAAKERQLRNYRGETAWATVEEVDEAARKWRLMGLSDAAIQNAAGMASHHPIKHRRHRRSTLLAIANLTEGAFHGKAYVYADLTRYRIQSLMAAGHRLKDMPVSTTGRWRERPLITVDQARTIRDYFAAHEFELGPDAHTAARARNAGALPPLAWDDPGTLAWPDGKRPRITMRRDRGRPHTELDEIIVERLIAGDRIEGATAAEKNEAMRRWLAMGRSEKSLCDLHGWRDGRYGRALRTAS